MGIGAVRVETIYNLKTKQNRNTSSKFSISPNSKLKKKKPTEIPKKFPSTMTIIYKNQMSLIQQKTAFETLPGRFNRALIFYDICQCGWIK